MPITLVALVLAYLALGGEEDSKSNGPGHPQLERIDLIARNGKAPARPALELIVHNSGRGASVVTRARIEVLKAQELPLCYTQGDLPTSERYGVQLPADAVAGEVVEAPLHQQVGSDGNDRFRIDIGVAGDDPEEEHLEGLYLFELAVSLIHDGDGRSLPMGTAILSVPQLPFSAVYYLKEGELADLEDSYDMLDRHTPEEMWSSVMPCWQGNGEALLDAAGSSAARSPQLEEVLREAIVPSFSEGET